MDKTRPFGASAASSASASGTNVVLASLQAFNRSGAQAYLMLFSSPSAPATGTAAPVPTYDVPALGGSPASSGALALTQADLGEAGALFRSGLTVAFSTSATTYQPPADPTLFSIAGYTA